MELTHPDETDSQDSTHSHPFHPDTVESAYQTVNLQIPLDTLHNHLETVQHALETKLGDRTSLYDPLRLTGEIPHRLEEDPTPTADPYPARLHIEDGHYYLDSDTAKRQIIAGKQTRNLLEDEIDFDNPTKDEHLQIQETQHDLSKDVTLDEHTDQEIIDHAGTKYDIWETVADLLSIPDNSPALRTIKLVHEQCYDVREKSEHGTTGFVIGVPNMFLAGMRTEQRLFSALADTRMTPAKLVDLYGNRVSYKNPSKWGAKRGVSESAVIQNRNAATQTIANKYDTGTYPTNLTDTW